MLLAERNSFVSDVPCEAVSIALLSLLDSPVQLYATCNGCLKKGTCHRYPSYLLSPTESPKCSDSYLLQ